MKKYHGSFRLIDKEMKRKFKPGEFVFVQDMSDLFAGTVPVRYIMKILRRIREFPETTFLLQTKNPRGYIPFLAFNDIPRNAILGTTAETNYMVFNTPSKFTEYSMISKAQAPIFRLMWMYKIAKPDTYHKRFVSIEPILDFDLGEFVALIERVKPWAVL